MVSSIRDVSRVSLGDGLGYRPPLKWAGGKRWLVPTLRLIWENHRHRRLVEPFCGGLAVALGLVPDAALLNDINPHAINLYESLQRGLKVNIKMENEEEFYYEQRAQFNRLILANRAKSNKAAQLFYYLNRTGYNGLCRFNKQGAFNVPFGRYENLNYADLVKDFSRYKAIFANWKFSTGDFESIDIQRGDFIYADPPYDVEFTQYSKEGFSWEDQERLATWLAKHKGPVVLSNQATPAIIELYTKLKFDLDYRKAPRMISCSGDRSKALEVVATKGI